MDSLKAFAMGQATEGRTPRIFDWNKAAELILKHKPHCAVAGLASDMEWTAGVIFESGEIVDDSYTYLGSTWAEPVIELDGEQHPCWVMGDETKWNVHTKWPDEARSIIAKAEGGA